MVQYATEAATALMVVVLGAAGYFVIGALLVADVPATVLALLAQAYGKVGMTFPILAAFAVYLVVMPVWLLVQRVRWGRETFNAGRHLRYIEVTAPLVGLLATTLAMARAMQGFEPSKGMLTTSAFLVQHSGEAMWATAIGITEAYVALTLTWLFHFDDGSARP
jgi:hypothetical protein